MNFQTHYNYQKYSQPELNSGKTMVEKAGYISAQKRIENMILAGQRLVDYRKSQFDFPDGKIDEEFQDPTRTSNYDLADAFQQKTIAEQSIKARQTAQKRSESILDKEVDKSITDSEKTPE